MPQARILPSFELFSDEQKAVISRIGPLFRDAGDRHARGQLRRQAGEEVAALRPPDSAYSIPTWAESACNYIQNHFKPPPSNLPTPKMATTRQRARKWTDMWAEEHADDLQAHMQALGKGDGLKARNLAIKELTENVADDQKARYRQAARELKEADGLTTAQQLKNRKDLLKYARSVASGLNTTYGIPFSILLTGYKDDEGEWSVTALDNNDLIDPRVSAMSKSKEKEFNTVLTLWQKYVQDMADAIEADDDGPTANVVTVSKAAGASSRDTPLLQLDGAGHCIIPSDGDLAAFDAKELSRALREVWTAEYVLASGLPSATVPWVDIRAQPHNYFDVEQMWLEDVPVEDPSHIRRRSLLLLLQQYRARDHRFLRFTGVQRNGELEKANLYPPHPVHNDAGDQEAISADLSIPHGEAAPDRPSRILKSALRKKDKGKRRARKASSEESEASFTDDDEQNVTDLLGGDHTHPQGQTGPRSARPKTRPVTRLAMKNPSATIIEGLLTLSDYADQPPDEFRSQRDRHVNYVKALAPNDNRLQATADHVFGLRSTTVEVVQYGRITMLPWANWYYDSVHLPDPHHFDYGAMWDWLRSRQFITNDLFFNKAGQLEQLTLGCAMLLRELHDSAFDRASPSDDVVERESILCGGLNINSATDIIHSVLDLLLTITPPPSNAPIAMPTLATNAAVLVEPSIPSGPLVVEPAIVDTGEEADAVLGQAPHVAAGTVAGASAQPTADETLTGQTDAAGEGQSETEDVDITAESSEEGDMEPHDAYGAPDDVGPSDAALRKRKRAETGPSSGGVAVDTLQHAGAKPPSKVAKGHEFTEKITRSGRHTTLSERARGNVVLK
ncbi:hypothetical protein BDW22DRAFT_1445352 [Trametopsis cervina]|nr:hypothetical protein BDW22DRAFT_1445352 [Trametopsis cervina]